MRHEEEQETSLFTTTHAHLTMHVLLSLILDKRISPRLAAVARFIVHFAHVFDTSKLFEVARQLRLGRLVVLKPIQLNHNLHNTSTHKIRHE